MPWKAKQNLLKLKTPMRNSLSYYASLPHVHRPLQNRIRRSRRKHRTIRSLVNVRQAVIRRAQNLMPRNTKTCLKRSKQQDESGKECTRLSENRELSVRISGMVSHTSKPRYSPSKSALWVRAIWFGNGL